jgi:hypothetical protein
LINTKEILLEKMELLKILEEIEIASKIINNKNDSNLNPLDSIYQQLNTKISLVDRNSEVFKIIELYFNNSQAEYHTRNKNLILDEIFEIERIGEKDLFKKKYSSLNNKRYHFHLYRLLWHGTRTTNIMGILTNGLKIAPPNAPISGSMFGKGVYFADLISKSIQYCSSKDMGCVFLCEVALGNMLPLHKNKYIEKLENNFHSTYGIGTICPNNNDVFELENGCNIYFGKTIKNDDSKEYSQLFYNEYIVYDINQFYIKYLLKVKIERF